MVKFKAFQIKFDKDCLESLTQQQESGVNRRHCAYHIALHPAQFDDFGQSVKNELGQKIAKYDEKFGGIMLGYENVKLQSHLGVIGIDNCYIHLDIEADFFIFKPQIGMALKGIVTRTTPDHVGCLVYNTFNIYLPKPPHREEANWLGSHAQPGNQAEFKIVFVELTSRLPYIKGHLLSLSNEDGVLQHTDKNQSKKKVSKKIKFKATETEVNDVTESEHLKTPKKSRKQKDSESESQKQEKRHQRKEKRIKEENDIEELTGIKTLFEDASEDVSEVPKKQRRKSHSVSQETVELEDNKELLMHSGKKRKRSKSMSNEV